MKQSSIIKQAVLSEKSYKQMEIGRYTFLVDSHADKEAISKAVEDQFSIKVEKVNVLKRFAKTKRIAKSRKTVKISGAKKAVVYLEKGQSIAMLSPKSAPMGKKLKDQDKQKEKNQIDGKDK